MITRSTSRSSWRIVGTASLATVLLNAGAGQAIGGTWSVKSFQDQLVSV
jgi:hypothetical protein